MRWYAGIVLGLVFLLLLPAQVGGSEQGNTHVWTGEWQGHPLTVVVVARDRREADDIDRSQPWWTWGNTSTDAYLFYWSDDELVDLILDFSKEDGHPIARLYAPTTIQARESIRFGQGSYSMDKNLTPDLTIRSGDDAWVKDGKPVFDLTGEETNPTTGELDWVIRVGEEQPGVPEWVTRTTIRSDDPGIGYPHFGATLRADPDVPFEMAEPLMPTFPYLSAVKRQGHWGLIQPIFFSHVTRTIEQNWTGFHIAGMYQVNSISLPPATNFESPFAFYRFDDEAGRHANLVIRSDIWPAGDRNGPEPFHAQRTAARMTWTGEDHDLWRYSLTVNGTHAHEDTVLIGDTEITAVPYEKYPGWITSRSWPAVTFVEATEGETGSEGIYDFSVEDNYPVTEYVHARRLESPVEPLTAPENADELELENLEHDPHANLHAPYIDFPAIHPLRLDEGFRGEFSLEYDSRPELYVSPVDNRVHLLNAEEGIWNLGDGQVMRWSSNDESPYVNSWWLEHVSVYESKIIDDVAVASPGRITESLDLFEEAGFMLYSSNNTVELRALNDALQHPSVPIPDDRDSWRSFARAADRLQPELREPEDLASWMHHHDGESMTITGARASAARVTDNGFRFVLELRPDYLSDGNPFLKIGRLGEGRYLVKWDGEFSVKPLTSPRFTQTLTVPELTALESSDIELEITNHGSEDLAGATLTLEASGPGEWEESIEGINLDVFGESTVNVPVKWAPPTPGRWTIRPVITTTDGEDIPLKGVTTTVAEPPEVTTLQLLRTGGDTTTIVFGFLTLLGFAGVAGVTWWAQWRPDRMEPPDDRN